MSLFSKMDSTTRSSSRSVNIPIIRTLGIFQAILVIPIALFLGFCAFATLILPIASFFVYVSFVSSLITFLLSASVVFTIVLQLQSEYTARQTLKSEVVKSVLATLLWLGLFVDALVWPYQKVNLPVNIPGRPHKELELVESELKVFVDEFKRERVEKTAISVIVLFALFYSALVYSYILLRRDKNYRDRDHMIQMEDCDATLNNEEDGLLERVD